MPTSDSRPTTPGRWRGSPCRPFRPRPISATTSRTWIFHEPPITLSASATLTAFAALSALAAGAERRLRCRTHTEHLQRNLADRHVRMSHGAVEVNRATHIQNQRLVKLRVQRHPSLEHERELL